MQHALSSLANKGSNDGIVNEQGIGHGLWAEILIRNLLKCNCSYTPIVIVKP